MRVRAIVCDRRREPRSATPAKTFRSPPPSRTLLRLVFFLATIAPAAAWAADWALTGALGAHDPSIIKEGNMWWCFTTGAGLPVKYSADGLDWKQGVPLFAAELPWWRTYAPQMAPLDVWAPDIQRFGNRTWCYYAVSEFGTNNSAIGLKSCTSIAAGDWRDDGFVIGSKSGVDAYNAIDPNLTIDAAGNPWLVFGSWFDGIEIVALDPATMKPTGSVQRIARRANGIEGSNIVRANGYYYLFVSIDLCCQGVNSTYKISYGRSTNITGPYVDQNGAAMLNGAGSLLEVGGDRWKGPGGQDVYQNGNDWIIARHAYDATMNGLPTLRISDLYWDSAAWPTFIQPAAGAPLPPASAGAYASGATEVTVTWIAPANGFAPTGYTLERAADSNFTNGLTTFNLGAATSYVDTTTAANTIYFYRLSSVNSAGASAPTTAMQVQTLSANGSGASRFVNIATRAFCGTGNNVTIGGFVIAGGAAKKVLVRGVGPSLAGQGIGATELLADPSIEVHQGPAVIASNDNWTDNANAAEITSVSAQIGATALAGGDTKSAALLLTLSPGVYSFIASGKGGGSGIVLLEVYDADAAGSGSAFVNIATRADCTTGNGVTIGGFVVAGGAPKNVLIRAVGPTLTTQGLGQAEVLANPLIELHQGAAVIATNDNWSDNANAAQIVTTSARIGATPLASSDANSAALLLRLPPGVYSFIASGKASTTGIVLVEVYDAD